MMKLDVSTPKFTLGESRAFFFQTKASELDLGNLTDKFIGAISVSGDVVNTGQSYRLNGTLKARKSFVCDSCLTDAEQDLQLEFSEVFATHSEDENVTIFDGEFIPLDELLRDILVASEPLAEICRPDCRGLCSVCGHNLNEGTCDCDSFIPDPRLAKLKDLLPPIDD